MRLEDFAKDWKGNIDLQIVKDGKTIKKVSQPLIIPAYGQKAITILCETPIKPGKYIAIASLGTKDERPIRSIREILFK